MLWDKTAFIVGADEGMIEIAVRDHFNDLPDLDVASNNARESSQNYTRSYFEKLLHVPFRIPALGETETGIYVALLLVGRGSTRLALVLDACRDVDAVAIDDDVANVYSDPELDTRSGSVSRSFGHLLLNRHREGHRIDSAGELHKYPVAGGLDDAPFVLGDGGIYNLVAERFQSRQGPDFVGSHKPRGARDICRQYRRQPAFNTLNLQGESWRASQPLAPTHRRRRQIPIDGYMIPRNSRQRS